MNALIYGFRNRESYVEYLEAVVLSLLSERYNFGNEEDTVVGLDHKGNQCTYSVYNIKQAIKDNAK